MSEANITSLLILKVQYTQFNVFTEDVLQVCDKSEASLLV